MILNTGWNRSNLTLSDSALKIKGRSMELLINLLDLVQGQDNTLKSFLLTYFMSFRACLGQNLMKIESKIMLIQLLRNFR